MLKPKKSPRAPLLHGSTGHGSSLLSADVDLAEPKDLSVFLSSWGTSSVQFSCLYASFFQFLHVLHTMATETDHVKVGANKCWTTVTFTEISPTKRDIWRHHYNLEDYIIFTVLQND